MASVRSFPSRILPSIVSSSLEKIASTWMPPSSVTHFMLVPLSSSAYPSHRSGPNHLPLRLEIASRVFSTCGSKVLSSVTLGAE